VATTPVHLRPADWQRDRAALELVRRRVFIEEQGVPEPDEWDAADLEAWHLLAETPDREPVGTGRMDRTGKIGRIAVLPQWRGAGLGRRIVLRLVNHATESGYGSVYLHAQTAAENFYRGLGFRAEGPVFDEAGIPHVRMRLGIGPGNGQPEGRHGDPQRHRDARRVP
jgi:predicted GNAT family N-acyltransferase